MSRLPKLTVKAQIDSYGRVGKLDMVRGAKKVALTLYYDGTTGYPNQFVFEGRDAPTVAEVFSLVLDRFPQRQQGKKYPISSTSTLALGTNTIDVLVPFAGHLVGCGAYIDGGSAGNPKLSMVIRANDGNKAWSQHPLVEWKPMPPRGSMLSWTGRFPVDMNELLRIDVRDAVAAETLRYNWVLEL